jgi:DNA-binding transcriptional MerR regulator
MENKTYGTTEFARLAGVTVRALHYYDRLGLLQPRRTAEGHRVYSARDHESLEQIVALKSIGFPLKKIAALREAPPLELANILGAQRATLAEKRRLLDQAIAANWELEAALRSGERVDVNTVKRTAEVMADPNKGAQRRREDDALVRAKRRMLKNRVGQSPTSEQKVFMEQWQRLMHDIVDAVNEDAASPRAQDLAGRWITLVSPQWPSDRPRPSTYVGPPVPFEGLAASDQQLILDEIARYHGEITPIPHFDAQRFCAFISKALAVRQAN